GIEAVDEAAVLEVHQALGGDLQGVAVQREFPLLPQPPPGQGVEPDRAAQGDIADGRQGGRRGGLLAAEELAEHDADHMGDLISYLGRRGLAQKGALAPSTAGARPPILYEAPADQPTKGSPMTQTAWTVRSLKTGLDDAARAGEALAARVVEGADPVL